MRGPHRLAARPRAAYLIRSGARRRVLCEDCLADFETIRDDFASLDDWEDRYRYVIELGHALEPLGEAAHNESNKVRGCVNQVWLEREARTSADGQTERGRLCLSRGGRYH
jgi:sulfur transfer protein SufE